jgi:hypothetical protein
LKDIRGYQRLETPRNNSSRLDFSPGSACNIQGPDMKNIAMGHLRHYF